MERGLLQPLVFSYQSKFKLMDLRSSMCLSQKEVRQTQPTTASATLTDKRPMCSLGN